ncbi:hypothetical protein [Nonlabens sp. Asnod2-A12]|uniref:hypothetical protein n=1 Tax=Nonlabens sp. Asnod2-A12 TaxID=3160578 RepID=UPI00386E2452
MVQRERIKTLLNARDNKYFGSFFKDNGLSGRRNFTLLETYKILEFWQGEGNWGRLKAIKKKKIAGILHNKNYERTADEFKAALGSDSYKTNLISPKNIKKVIAHIDLTEENQVEDLIGYKETKTQFLWAFGILVLVFHLEQLELKQH